MRVAIYARVSTTRQEKDQTIDSQISVLTKWAQENGHELLPEHIFKDEGYSGTRLDRPGLDALRDAAQDGKFELIAVLSPDRLTRKYAYQVLLLEELRRVGCEFVFLHHPISDNPNDQLLLQIQGAIAEYERVLLRERFRRGKLQKARDGYYLCGRTPYGYSYVHKRDGIPGHLVINETEAELVRTLYKWLTEERLTIRQILKRLNTGLWYPRSGNRRWSSSVVHHILSDPIYIGTAYVNRYKYVPAKKPRLRGPMAKEYSTRQLKPRQEWIPISVPPIVTQEIFDQAAAQLVRNSTLSFRNNSKHNYLLRCLLTCKTCGLAMFGRVRNSTATSPNLRYYYLCHGKDCILTAREKACPSRHVKAEDIEPVVWNHVCNLLNNPNQLLAQFESFAQIARQDQAKYKTEANKLELNLARFEREEKRLLDAYQAEVITLEELATRRKQLGERRQALILEQERQKKLWQQSVKADRVLEDLTNFCQRIRSRLQNATFAEKQAILQLVIDRIIVGEDTLEIRHVIPLRNLPPGDGSDSDPPKVRLRSDGVSTTSLHRLMAKDLLYSCSQCF
jgi:site-specific DNA recombinase